MADMRIFGQVAQSQSPYGRITPLGQPGALRPSPYKSALGEMLGNMFDELNTPDDKEFRKQEKLLVDQIEYAKEKGIGGNPITQRNMLDDIKQLEARLTHLRENPPEETSSFERGLDKVTSYAGDLFGIDAAANQEKEERANKASNLLNYWR